jgi:hypothetical protein
MVGRKVCRIVWLNLKTVASVRGIDLGRILGNVECCAGDVRLVVSLRPLHLTSSGTELEVLLLGRANL